MKQKYIYMLLIITLVYTSCYKEDFSDCPILLHVYFESVMEKYRYEDIVDEMDLYLYDENHRLVQQQHFTVDQLRETDYNAILSVERFGKYTLSSVLNVGQSYIVFGTDNLDNLNINIKAQKGDTVNRQPSDVYYSFKDIRVQDVGSCVQYDTLALYKNTNHINVDISFEGGWPDNIKLHGYLKGNNGGFDYKNRTLVSSLRVYLPYKRQTTGQYHELMNFTTMQILRGSDLTLYIDAEYNGTREQKYELDIYQYLAKIYTDEELEQEDEFDIKIVLSSDYTIFELVINDWYLIRQGTEV